MANVDMLRVEVVDDGIDEFSSPSKQVVGRGYNFSSMCGKQALDFASKVFYFFIILVADHFSLITF
jgi:hypothetical protein